MTKQNYIGFYAHNPKVVSSNLARATNIQLSKLVQKAHIKWAFFCLAFFMPEKIRMLSDHYWGQSNTRGAESPMGKRRIESHHCPLLQR